MAKVWNIGGVEIKDTGGTYFGLKDVSQAINAGVSYQDVQKFLAEKGNPEAGVKAHHTGALQTAIDQAKQGSIANTLGGQYVGAADVNLYQQVQQQAGTSSGDISRSIRDAYSQAGAFNPQGGDAYNTMYGHHMNIAAAADQADHTAMQAAHNAAEAERNRRHRDRMFLQAQQAAEQARLDAMKVKHGATSGVGRGQSAMSIRFARTKPLKGGAGLSGTASLGRGSAKGSEVSGLNI